MLNYKNKTFSDEVVREMLSQPARVTLEDIIIHTVNRKLEEESVRLAKAVCEYERIVDTLEDELRIERELRKDAEERIDKIIERYNRLVHKYNKLIDYINE